MEGAGCIVLLIMAGVFVAGLIVISNENQRKAKELREAEEVYRASLQALKISPTNADLKEEALQKGRVYSNLTRDRRGVTMFDEVALMNDINAASAGAATARAGSTPRSIEDRLAHLQALRERSLVTEQEYEQRRAEILREV